MIEFFIPMLPVAKGRPRMTKRGIAYTPSATRAAEKQVALEAIQYAPVKIFTGPVALTITFCMPVPASIGKKKSAEMMGHPHIKKPDVDNLAKLVLDAIGMTGRYWRDDSQVFDLRCIKKYRELPGIGISIQAWED